MNPSSLPALLIFYGLFLIACGFVSVIFIGRKAKTALMSGGISGVFVISTAIMIMNGNRPAVMGGIFIALALFIVFSWRATKTLYKIFELMPIGSPELNGKGVAFLVISLMAVVSMVVFILQLTSISYAA